MEREIIRELCRNAEVRAALNEGKRLLAVRVVPLGTFTHLAIVLCPPPSEPESPGLPEAPTGLGEVVHT